MIRTIVLTIEGATKRDVELAENRLHDSLLWMKPPAWRQVVFTCEGDIGSIEKTPEAVGRFLFGQAPSDEAQRT